MSLAQRLLGLIGGEPPMIEAVGTIIDGPRADHDGKSDTHLRVFRIDSLPDVEFRQVASPLAAERRRGDRVRVHYQLEGANLARVAWIETAHSA